MIHKLQKIYHILNVEWEKHKNLNVVDEKSGLSEREKNRVENYKSFTESTADFFGHPFYFSHGRSFIHTWEEIFQHEIYRFNSDREDPFIIDCGANIGLSTYYFKKQYPKSKVIAFEPDRKIFEILKKNIEFFPNKDNLEIRNEAVWTENTTLKFFSEGALSGSSVVDFSENNNVVEVKAIDLKELLRNRVDFLKIDIEGAENTLIFDIKNHLHNVDKMFLEFHGLKDEPQNLGAILNLLSEVGFEYYIKNASDLIRHPFCDEKPRIFNQQLNIFCFRKK